MDIQNMMKNIISVIHSVI